MSLARTARTMARSARTMGRSVAGRAGRTALRRSVVGQRALREAQLLRGLRAIERSGLFDQRWYELQARETFPSRRAAVLHYQRVGRYRDLSPHPLYEPRSHVRDQRKRRHARISPFALFLQQVRLPRVRPHYLFDVDRYREQNPGAAAHRFGAWGHFLQRAAGDPTLPLPLSRALPDVTLPYGEFVAHQHRHAARWAEQDVLARPARLTDHHDHGAQRRLLAEVERYAVPATTDGVPLVSVITTVRNRPHHILEAIASVTAQTLSGWELIVVDDGSDDVTPDVVDEIARRDARVHLLRREHAGVSAARNAGAAVARGRYVAWLDSDNTWQPRFLEVMVRAMDGRELRAAYSACTFTTGAGVRYREFAGGLEHLGIGNFVDLNVLMVRRELLDEVGGFDPTLPRAVDYDLVYRIARRVEPIYLPFLGTDYSDDADDPDRISVKELKTWNYVVRDRHTVDWERLRRTLDRRTPGRVSVVVAGRERWDDIWNSVLAVLRHTDPGADLEVIVVDGGSRRAASLLIAAVELFDPRVRVLRTPVNLNAAANTNLGFADSTGELLIAVSPSAEVGEGWLPPLRATLDDPKVAAAAPLLVDTDGRIASAGTVIPTGPVAPAPFLGDRPVAEAAGLAHPQPVPALGRGVFAVRAADLVRLRGYDPLYVDAFEEADLGLRLRREHPGTELVVVPDAVATEPLYLPFGLGEQDRGNLDLFAHRWSDQADDRPDLWALAGHRLTGYRSLTLVPPRRHVHEPEVSVTVVRPVLAPEEETTP